jgi:hypothetical protein
MKLSLTQALIVLALISCSYIGAEAMPNCGVLKPGARLNAGASITSCSGVARLVMQSDGNLVLYRSDGQSIWASQTNGRPASHLIMQNDGHLVIYGKDGKATWGTHTNGRNGAYLFVQDDGNVVLYQNNGPIWSSNSTLFGCGSIAIGVKLMPGIRVWNCNRNGYLVYQSDGNFVLYRYDGKALWSSDTPGRSAGYAIQQRDGNFVLYDSANKPYWATGTNGRTAAGFYIQEDLRLAIYHNNTPVWITPQQSLLPVPAPGDTNWIEVENHLFQKIHDMPLSYGHECFVADVGYGLKVDALYRPAQGLIYNGPSSFVNYMLPVHDTNNGAYIGFLYNYNYEGLHWVYRRTAGDWERDKLIVGYINGTRTRKTHHDGEVQRDGDVLTMFSGVRLMNKGKGQVIVDQNGTKILENGVSYGSTTSYDSKVFTDDHGGNSALMYNMKAEYNGGTLNFAEATLCFKAGTKVQTEKGLMNIEKIQKGMKVKAWDEVRNRFDFKPVSKTKRSMAEKIVKLYIDGELYEVTEKHPFRTASGQWVAAAKLEVGQTLLTVNGAQRTVSGLSIVDEKVEVYNLEVLEYYTYAIGEDGIVVHNQCKVQENWNAGATMTIEFFKGVGMYVTIQQGTLSQPICGTCVYTPIYRVTEVGYGVGVGAGAKVARDGINIAADEKASGAAGSAAAGVAFVVDYNGLKITPQLFARASADLGQMFQAGLNFKQNLDRMNVRVLEGSTVGGSASIFNIFQAELSVKSMYDKNGNLDFSGSTFYTIPFKNLFWDPKIGVGGSFRLGKF